jgi:carbon-monoxide dehydrogenase medium subunit
LLSGGQSLIPMMKLRLVSPEHIVDINRIPILITFPRADGHLQHRRLAREHQLETSDVVKKLPISRHAKVHRRSTRAQPGDVCGNLAHGDPANDHPATMLALGATVVATGRKASARSRSQTSFQAYSRPHSTRGDLTEIRIPFPRREVEARI